MSWVKLDDRFFDNPKIAGISDAAKVAYLKSITYCARNLTDGKFPAALGLELASGKKRVVLEITETGLWERGEKGVLHVHDYLDYNPTREKVLADKAVLNEARSKAGSKGAAVRWQKDGNEDSKPIANDMAPLPVNPDTPYSLPVNPPPEPTDPTFAAVKEMWLGRIGDLTKADEAEMAALCRKVSLAWFTEAIEETENKADEAFWPYCRAVLKRCLMDGRSPKGKKRPKAAAGSARSQFAARIG